MNCAAARPGQTLLEHLRNVAEKTSSFASEFHTPTWGKLAGFSHDWGKFAPDWQAYLEDQTGQVNHAPQSASLCFRIYGNMLGGLLAYAIKGHHSHLPDWDGDLGNLAAKREDALFASLDSAAIPEASSEKLISELKSVLTSPDSLQLWIRMLSSAVVDADRLDAEQFTQPDHSALRGQYESWSVLSEKFDSAMKEKEKTASLSPVNRIRHEILEEVLSKASGTPGFYSLNVPTGGGKTLAAMAFALKHLNSNHLKRIVMAIPLNSITGQTAKVYKDIFGAGNVLEHHSNFDLGENPRYLLAAENWDMPIIVSTNVMLFESLLKSGASGLRKIHNLVNSIIILDEAQMLPGENLLPILSTLRTLVKDFGCTVVLCSATIPALEGKIPHNLTPLDGLPPAIPLISEPEKLFSALCRTKILHKGKTSMDAVAQWADAAKQSLCIVNTRRHSRELFQKIRSEKKYHLSAAMCPAERTEILDEIRKELKRGTELVIVSTQLIEAGVDIDVRTVFRELAGIDSIAQAAGRCNREGLNPRGYGDVFTFDLGNPPISLSNGYKIAKEFLPEDGTPLELTPRLFHDYFKHYYHEYKTFDKAIFNTRLIVNSKEKQFDSFSSDFRMIDDEYQASLVVLYGNSADVIEELRRTEKPTRALFRQLQQYTVNMPKMQLEKWRNSNCVERIGDIYIQLSPGIYEKGLGVVPDDGAGLCFG